MSFLLDTLRFWRAAAPGKRAVNKLHGEIVLSEWSRFELREAFFPSMQAAADAIASGEISWQPAKPKLGARRQ